MSEFTGLNFLEVEDLPYLKYLVWRRDAFIWWLSRTEKGEEYLDNAWRMEQTEPDRASLRKKLKREGSANGEK